MQIIYPCLYLSLLIPFTETIRLSAVFFLFVLRLVQDCEPCALGYWSPSGAPSCSQCPIATFAAQLGTPICPKCLNGAVCEAREEEKRNLKIICVDFVSTSWLCLL
jgi:hypothetical protein